MANNLLLLLFVSLVAILPVLLIKQYINNNNKILFGALGPFRLNSEETITADYVFVRARNSEFNYSANSSFISGSTGEVIYDNFINAPQVYVTTVGLYNDSNELLAVAKLSKPLLKDFTKESLLRVKLSY